MFSHSARPEGQRSVVFLQCMDLVMLLHDTGFVKRAGKHCRIFVLLLKIYLLILERLNGEHRAEGEREFSLLSVEPNPGLDLTTLRP